VGAWVGGWVGGVGGGESVSSMGVGWGVGRSNKKAGVRSEQAGVCRHTRQLAHHLWGALGIDVEGAVRAPHHHHVALFFGGELEAADDAVAPLQALCTSKGENGGGGGGWGVGWGWGTLTGKPVCEVGCLLIARQDCFFHFEKLHIASTLQSKNKRPTTQSRTCNPCWRLDYGAHVRSAQRGRRPRRTSPLPRRAQER
jgi:hypothetical protein